MQLTPTHFAEGSSGLGALGVDGKAFVIQLITFVLAYVVLQRYAFKPILKVLQERRETIENGVKLGEQMQQEKLTLEAKVAARLHAARQEADGIISAAQDSGRQAIREAEDKARDKAASILKESEVRLATDTARARQQLEKEMVNLVSEATEAIIHEKLNAPKDNALIERMLKELQTV